MASLKWCKESAFCIFSTVCRRILPNQVSSFLINAMWRHLVFQNGTSYLYFLMMSPALFHTEVLVQAVPDRNEKFDERKANEKSHRSSHWRNDSIEIEKINLCDHFGIWTWNCYVQAAKNYMLKQLTYLYDCNQQTHIDLSATSLMFAVPMYSTYLQGLSQILSDHLSFIVKDASAMILLAQFAATDVVQYWVGCGIRKLP